MVEFIYSDKPVLFLLLCPQCVEQRSKSECTSLWLTVSTDDGVW